MTMTEVKVTNKKGIGFYVRAAKNFLEGVEGKEGVEAKPAEKEITVTALGNAISYAVAVATSVEKSEVAKIAKVETSYPPMSNGSANGVERGVAQIKIVLEKC